MRYSIQRVGQTRPFGTPRFMPLGQRFFTDLFRKYRAAIDKDHRSTRGISKIAHAWYLHVSPQLAFLRHCHGILDSLTISSRYG